ncbi:MAG: FecR domain-containing protein [Myxococcales bacterium]
MSERLAERLSQAREHLDADFGSREVERGLAGLQQRIRRRRRVTQATGALTVLTLLVGSWLLLPRASEVARQSESGPAVAGSRALRTADGLVARLLSPQTVLQLEHERQDEVSLQLEHGSGHFEVTRNPRRRYRVRAGQVDVEVLGTAFEVTRQAAGARVRVEHGLVRVRWPSGEQLLHAGESGEFPPVVSAPVAAASEPVQEVEASVSAREPIQDADLLVDPSLRSTVLARDRSRERWRALERAGKHREAFGSLGERPVEDLAGLLLAADAARLSGHPQQAATYLQRLMRRYPRTAPARLAAFTLGRLALRELSDPALAARSFARAYALDPKGPLAEDALAREAEAYHRAGDLGRARKAATRYIEQFPDGVRRDDISRYLAP